MFNCSSSEGEEERGREESSGTDQRDEGRQTQASLLQSKERSHNSKTNQAGQSAM